MAQSILDSTKKSLQLAADYDVFDPDIIMHINTALATLTQIGIGPVEGFMIEDADATWDAFMGVDPRLSLVKSYVFYKVRLAFDPPTTSYHIEAIQKQIEETEWRLSIQREINLNTISVTVPSETTIDGGGAQHL